MSETEREGEWEIYPTEIDEDGNPAVILFDASPVEEAPIEGFDRLARVIVTLKDPDPETMLVQAHESKVLYEIEDALVSRMVEGFGARYVGRVATLGVCDFAFYLPAPEGLEDAISEVFSAWADYEVELELSEDPDWDFYGDVLFPSRQDWQWIMDRRVVANLEDEGDPLEPPRPVDHHVDLPDKEAVAAFLDGLKGWEHVGTEAGEEGLSVHLRQTHSVDLDTITGVTGFLLERAIELGGDYDGWGCEVMSS